MSDTKTAEEIKAECLPRLTGQANELELLEAYCSTKARLLEAESYLEEHGLTIILRNDKGDPKSVVEAPQVRIAERCRDAVLEISRKLKLKKV